MDHHDHPHPHSTAASPTATDQTLISAPTPELKLSRIPPAGVLSARLREARRLLASLVAVCDVDAVVAGHLQLAAAELDGLCLPLPPPPMVTPAPSEDLTRDLNRVIGLLTDELAEAATEGPMTAVDAVTVAAVVRELRGVIAELPRPETPPGTATSLCP